MRKESIYSALEPIARGKRAYTRRQNQLTKDKSMYAVFDGLFAQSVAAFALAPALAPASRATRGRVLIQLPSRHFDGYVRLPFLTAGGGGSGGGGGVAGDREAVVGDGHGREEAAGAGPSKRRGGAALQYISAAQGGGDSGRRGREDANADR
eukprot:2738441-Pyramimonas_sp.AAC.1